MSNHKQIKFGVMLYGPGNHMNAWKDPEVPIDASVNLEFFKEITQRAEKAGFAFAFVADGLYIDEKSIPHFLNRFEPITILTALAMVTSKIGLVGTISTSYSEPYTIARQLASLDKISNGRAGWNAVTSPLEGSASNYNKGPHPSHSLRYEMANEHLEVTKGLWDSWEDGAFIRNRETGQFYDPTKVHRLNYKGKYFSVAGPLNIERSKQGQPVIFQAGSSESGRAFAAKHAEAVFTVSRTIEEAKEFYSNIKKQAKQNGRSENEVIIVQGLEVIVGATEAEAEDRYEKLKNLVTIEEALNYLSRYFDHFDFSPFPLDEPFPDIGDIGENSFQSTTKSIKQWAKEENLTLREVALSVTTPKTTFFGSYEQVANQLIKWVDEDATDGYMLTVPVLGGIYTDFIDYVIPILEERGYYNRGYVGDTLRDHLGLPFKKNRNTKNKKEIAEKVKV